VTRAGQIADYNPVTGLRELRATSARRTPSRCEGRQEFAGCSWLEDGPTHARGKHKCNSECNRDLPHVEVADDYPGIHFRVVTAKVLPYVGVLPVENTAIQHWRVSTAFYVGEQLGPGEVPHGVVAHETCELFLVIVRQNRKKNSRESSSY